MNGMVAVQQRIMEIEKRYAPKEQSATDKLSTTATASGKLGAQPSFSSALKKAINVQDGGDQDQVKQMVSAAAQKYQVPENFALAVAKAESGYDAQAVSAAGASGVMQLMPDTAAMLGVSDTLNPKQNIDGGVRYLGMMLQKFNGDYRLAAAAYNAGPGAVEQYGGVPPYSETRAYVDNVIKTANGGGAG